MENRHCSAESSPPMDKRAQNAVQNAGLPVADGAPQDVTFPAQEQAAARSRRQMYAYQETADRSEHVLGAQNPSVQNAARQMRMDPSRTDPLGSWTGVPQDPTETPVQDADDL